jgi:hypothetical protein
MLKNPIKSFRTHANYIRAFGRLIYEPVAPSQGNPFERLKNRILNANVLPQRDKTKADLAQVKASLNMAWGTEAIIMMIGRIINEDELLRLSNNWVSIQVYYVFYHCTQALHVAKGHPRPESHPSTQNIFCDFWAAKSICLPPWSLAYGSKGVINSPYQINVDVSIHSWSSCEGDNIWSLAAKALMTTRKYSFAERCREQRALKKKHLKRDWELQEAERLKKGNKPRKKPTFQLPNLTTNEKEKIFNQLRPYTIIDYLYRLRLKTNYEDSNMFSDGPEDNISSYNVRAALCKIASGTLFLHELAIRNLVGRETFLKWVDEWNKRHLPQGFCTGLISRRIYFE